MAATPRVPNTQKSEPRRTNEQPPARVVENKPAATLAQALSNAEKQANATK